MLERFFILRIIKRFLFYTPIQGYMFAVEAKGVGSKHEKKAPKKAPQSWFVCLQWK